MRAAARALAGLGVVTLVVGIGWAFAVRSGGDTAIPALLLVIGVAATGDAVAVYVLAERQPDGLRVADHQSLPPPMWWPPLLAAGLVALVGGGWISPAVAGLGIAVVVLAAVGAALQLRQRPREPGPHDRRTVRLARQVLDFGRRHAAATDASVSAMIEPLGRDSVRVVLVGADGTFGDLVVRDQTTAGAVLALAGADVRDALSRELAARIRTGRYEWIRMAGSQLGVPRA